MHVALDGGDDDLALRRRAGAQLFFLDVGHQMGDRLLHDARRLDHLRQEHLARAEQVANRIHAGHQGAFDDVQRRLAGGCQCRTAFLGVGDNVFGDAAHHGVFEALLDRPFAPGQIDDLFLGAALDGGSEFHQRVTRTGLSVQYDVFHLLAQYRIELVIHAQLAGVDDAHGEAGLDRVVEENGVDRLAHRLVATERKRDVRDAARNIGVRQIRANPAAGLDEVDGVVVVLGNASGDGKHVGVEDDVLGWETVADQQVVRALADLDLALVGVGLTGFVEGHDNHRRAEAAGFAGIGEEFFLALLHRDRVDDALALRALEAGLDDFPLGRVEHQWHARNIRLAGDKVGEAHHRGLAVQHRLVHVDVDDLRAVFHLLACDGQRVVEAAFENHLREGARAGDVGAFADVDEQRLCTDVAGFETGKAQ